MNKEEFMLVDRLIRCTQRLAEEYRLAAPTVIKKTELLLIKELCEELLNK